MRTPLVNAFIFGSEAYHDYYRWPVKDRRIFEQWLAETPWEALFQRYRRQGTIAASKVEYDHQRT